MLLWFATIAVVGAAGIRQNPEILAALNPFHAVHYLVTAHLPVSFAMLGAAFPGGHGRRGDVRRSRPFRARTDPYGVVHDRAARPRAELPRPGALLLSNPEAVDNPFFQLAPGWIHYLLVAFATLATVIASQAIISGAFSLTEQAIKLGFFPRMRIVHTSGEEAGQIYVPIVNWLLAIATLGAVLAFGSSTRSRAPTVSRCHC